MHAPAFWIFSLTAFLLGSVPTSYIFVRKIKGLDIRKEGSQNPGATNAARILGRKWGFLVFVIDVSKGYISAWLLPLILYHTNLAPEALELLNIKGIGLLFGIAAFLGHCYSPFLAFRGGKGVATALGVYAVVAPQALLLTLAVCAIIVAITRLISLASITGAILLPISILVFGWENPPWVVFAVTTILGSFVVFRHRSNIQRLIRGSEIKS